VCIGRYLHLCENIRRDLQLLDVEVHVTVLLADEVELCLLLHVEVCVSNCDVARIVIIPLT